MSRLNVVVAIGFICLGLLPAAVEFAMPGSLAQLEHIVNPDDAQRTAYRPFRQPVGYWSAF